MIRTVLQFKKAQTGLFLQKNTIPWAAPSDHQPCHRIGCYKLLWQSRKQEELDLPSKITPAQYKLWDQAMIHYHRCCGHFGQCTGHNKQCGGGNDIKHIHAILVWICSYPWIAFRLPTCPLREPTSDTTLPIQEWPYTLLRLWATLSSETPSPGSSCSWAYLLGSHTGHQSSLTGVPGISFIFSTLPYSKADC